MSRASVAVLLVALLGLLPPSAARADDVSVEAKRAADVRQLLSSTVKFGGIDDAETKLEEALNYLHMLYGFTIEVNEQAFKDEGIDDVNNRPLGRSFRKRAEDTPELALRRILRTIPSTSGTVFVVRGGTVEITTRRAASPSSWRAGPNPPEPPDISAKFDKRELQEALQEIADATGVNVVLDARATGKTPITATLRDVAVDTAVELIADMADLATVPVDDVLYVTTKQNAETLRKTHPNRRPADAAGPMAAKAESAPLKAETERLLKDNADSIRRIKDAVERRRPAGR